MARATERHLAHFSVVEALRGAKGCPLCLLEAACARRHFASLLHEHVNDPEVRGELGRARGYCGRHARLLLSQGDGFGTAILYRDQVELFATLLRALQRAPRRGLRRAELAGWLGHEACPACRAQAQDRQRYIAVLLNGLQDDEMRSALDASPALCVPHFVAVLQAARDPQERSCLIEAQGRKLDRLLHDLDEFCRKHDYRFRQEGMGAEGDAWRRAVEAMTGDADVF